MSMEAPQDLDAERQVLGALLVRPDMALQLNSIIQSSDFYLASHRVIYETLIALQQEDAEGQTDPLQVINYLRDREKLNAAGGDAYILQIAEESMAPANSPVHARRLKNLSLRRALIEAAQSIQEDAEGAIEDEIQFLKNVEDKILNITNRSFVQGIWSVRDLKDEFSEYIENLIRTKGMQSGVRTHFDEFDNLTTGLKPGELIILAARPGMGKTTLAMNLAANVALLGKGNVLVYSLEMGRLELLMRMVCSVSQFNHSDLKRGNIPQGRAQDILGAIEQIFSSGMHIDDTGTLDIWDCIVRSRKLAIELDKKGESLDLIIVDYLQLLTDPESRKMGRQNEVAAISRNLKQLSKTVKCPILALSQMNRSVEQRKGGDSRPQLSDLRESGAIEQDADIVMFIHQDHYGKDEEGDDLESDLQRMEDKGTAEVIIAKHRNGPVGSFRLAFRPEINRFDNAPAREPTFSGA